jgi:cytoskeleton protein RodZ
MSEPERVDSPDTPGTAEPVAPGSLGATLRAAREAQKLTAQDIAARLNLDLRVITALEADHFEELRVPAYVRGYLRSYARQVGLDPDAMVRGFDALSAAPAPVLHPFRSRPPAQTDTSHHGVRLATVAVVVVVLGLAFSWWRARDIAPGEAPIVAELPPGASVPPPSVGEASSGGSSYRYPVVNHDAPPGADAPPPLPAYTDAAAPIAAGESAYTPPAEGLDAAPSPSGADAAPDSLAPAAGELPPVDGAQARAAVDASADDAAALDAGAAATTAAVADAAGVGSAAAGTVSIAVSLAGKSWVEIYDANDKRLFFNMASAGQTIATRGDGPLRVIVGNIRAARLSVGGRDIPLEPLAREGVARLLVTAEGAEPLRRPGE